MKVLIVQSQPELGTVWQKHLQRQGDQVARVGTQDDAIAYLAEHEIDIIVLDLVLPVGSALSVADYANYRRPDARVIFVTGTTFFSDGSIFAHSANARAFIAINTPPEDLAAMVEHIGAELKAG